MVDMDIILFAIKAHAGQTYGKKPYHYHLCAVSGVLFRFGYHDADLHAAAWLHDVLEDTDKTRTEIASVVGEDVAELVWRVTCAEGKNRRERFSETYPKIRDDARAVAIKLADRIANVESCVTNRLVTLYHMYKKEYPDFHEALFKAGEHEALWSHLDRIFSTGTVQHTIT